MYAHYTECNVYELIEVANKYYLLHFFENQTGEIIYKDFSFVIVCVLSYPMINIFLTQN